MASFDYTFVRSRPTFTDLATWTRRMLLINQQDPEDFIEVLVNPESLTLEFDVEAGALNPIGSSSSVRQYAYTKGVEFELELYLSAQLALQRSYEARERGVAAATVAALSTTGIVNEMIAWITSFGFPQGTTVAPPPLLVVWPNTLAMAVIVLGASVNYVLWDKTGTPRVARVNLRVAELRSTGSPRYTYEFRQNGFATSSELMSAISNRSSYNYSDYSASGSGPRGKTTKTSGNR